MTTNNKEDIALFYKMQKQLRKAFTKKLCMAPAAMKNACSKKKPNCHAISKGASLKRIAPDNHVYTIGSSIENFYKPIGINEATG